MSINYNLVLHMDSYDANIFRLVARNATNYLNALANKDVDLRVVANAGAVKLFTAINPGLRELAIPLVQRGVRFVLCANALAENKIEHADLWPECEVTPAGLVEIVRLQREGFAYVKP